MDFYNYDANLTYGRKSLWGQKKPKKGSTEYPFQDLLFSFATIYIVFECMEHHIGCVQTPFRLLEFILGMGVRNTALIYIHL